MHFGYIELPIAIDENQRRFSNDGAGKVRAER
jgi:hypothetical protein